MVFTSEASDMYTETIVPMNRDVTTCQFMSFGAYFEAAAINTGPDDFIFHTFMLFDFPMHYTQLKYLIVDPTTLSTNCFYIDYGTTDYTIGVDDTFAPA